MPRDTFAGDQSPKAVTGDGLEVGDGAEGEVARSGGGEDGLGDGVFAALFERGQRGQEIVGGKGGVERADFGDREPAGGDGPGLVEKDGLNAADAFQNIAAANEDSGAGGQAEGQRGHQRRGEAQSARAGDDYDRKGDRGGANHAERTGGEVPISPGRCGEKQDEGDEKRSSAVGQAFGAGRGQAEVFDQVDDALQEDVGADLVGLDEQSPFAVGSAGQDAVAGAARSRGGLAGEGGVGDGTRAFEDGAVGGESLAGSDAESVAGAKVSQGNFVQPLSFLSQRRRGQQCFEVADQPPGASLGRGFEEFAESDQGGEHGGRVEIDVARAANGVGGARGKGGQGTQGDQGVEAEPSAAEVLGGARGEGVDEEDHGGRGQGE